jgi:hypothetical protein
MAYVSFESKTNPEVMTRIPIIEEDGRLVPCPDGTRLLGQVA